MKRYVYAAAALLLLWTGVPQAGAVDCSAISAVVMEAETGRVLYEKQAHQRRPIASITKLMTVLVALDSGHGLEEEVTIQPEWTGIEGSSLYLAPGETVRLETLLYGLMLRSGNDGAEAIAGWCGGSREEFIARMNQKAAQLGMGDSQFADPSGLSDENHWSSAYDMALLARTCLAQPELAKIVATKAITLEGRAFVNHNKLLWRYPGCVGMKTGFTKQAGRTLVSAAEREGMTLICVTLHDPDDWADHAALLDWAFARFSMQTVVQAGETLCRLPVTGSLLPFGPAVAGERAILCLAEGEQPRLRLELDRTTLAAPVAAGERLGRAIYELNGAELAAVPVETGCALPDLTPPRRGPLAWLQGRLGGAGKTMTGG